MKKLFKASKQKPPAAPTPLSLPPETPIHAQRQRTLPPRPSAEAILNDEKWVVVSDEQTFTGPPRSRRDSRQSSITSLPPGASPPQSQIAATTHHNIPNSQSPLLHTPQSQANTKRKSASVFPWPDSRVVDHVQTSVDNLYPVSVHSADAKEIKETKESRLGNFLWGSRDKEKASEKDHGHRTKDKEAETPWDLTRMIGGLTATASEDWSLVLELCERASANETSAKEASRALRRIFKYGEPSAQLSAARLWAIMLRNCSETFIKESASRKTLDAVEDTITSTATTPVVKERLLNVVASAAFQFSKNDRKHPYAALWRKVKPPGAPEQGIPIDPTDPMYTPPLVNPSNHQRPVPLDRITTSPFRVHQESSPVDSAGTEATGRPKKTRHRQRTITPEEDIARVFHDCEDAHTNARFLSDVLAFALPTDLEVDNGGVIREFYAKCVESQNRLVGQIPWATSLAERSRAAHRPPSERSSPDGADVHHGTKPSTVTREEEMLAALLGANQAVFEAIRVHDDLQRVAIAEREEHAVEERSRVETRFDRSQLYLAPDGSLYAPEYDGGGGGSSRSPSPSHQTFQSRATESSPSSFNAPIPRSSPRPPVMSHPDVASAPNPSSNPSQWNNYAQSQHRQSSHNISGHRHAPQGPRAPALHSNSRPASPDISALGLGLHGTNVPATHHEVLHRGSDPNVAVESLRAKVTEMDLGRHLEHHAVSPSTRTGRRKLGSGGIVDDSGSEFADEEVILTAPVVPSAKALGKRRAVEKEVDPDGFDPDDIFKDTRPPTPLSVYMDNSSEEDDDDGVSRRKKVQPTVYVYDAAAERELERRKALLFVGGQTVPDHIVSTDGRVNGVVH